MMSVNAGPELIEFVKLCYAANRPVLLTGSHGVGKSELLKADAESMHIKSICLDLSLMEPPDLIGIPQVSKGQTVYAPPAILPRKGKGLLVFEELNRCESYMRAPCLQLLTERKLNGYDLPSGWLPVAAINPSDGPYETDSLDPALRSRFVEVQVKADRDAWLQWANSSGHVHSTVIQYVERSGCPIFEQPLSNPRSWSYVSDLVCAAEKQNASSFILQAAVIGMIGFELGKDFIEYRGNGDQPVDADALLSRYDGLIRSKVKQWVQTQSLEPLEDSLTNLLIAIQNEDDYNQVCATRKKKRNMAIFLHDLPADLRNRAKASFKDRSRTFPRKPRTGTGSRTTP